jgi:hypothetical protein
MDILGWKIRGLLLYKAMLKGNSSFFMFIGYSLYNWSIVDVIEL